MKKLLLFWFALNMFMPLLAWAADVDPLLQNPVITDTDLQVKVTYSSTTGIYEYRYTVASGASNLGNIDFFGIDLVTMSSQNNMYDTDLYSDDARRDGTNGVSTAPKRSVPIGLQSPGPRDLWFSAVNVGGMVFWGPINVSAFILPGQTLEGFIIQAKAPPGPRKFSIRPDFKYTGFPYDDYDGPPYPENYKITGTTIGPVLASELKLYDDKGLPAAPDAFSLTPILLRRPPFFRRERRPLT